MRSLGRRILLRIGLTGKLMLLAGSLLALSQGLLVGLAWWGAARVIRAELETTSKVRILEWAAVHLEAIEANDQWSLAKSVEDLRRDPYVIYAGVFDRAGMPIAQAGDPRARERARTHAVMHVLRSGEIREFAAAPPDRKPEPLPGLVPGLDEEAPGTTFSQRFSAVLGDLGRRSEDLVGFVEITLDTAPLERLTALVMRPLLGVSVALLLAGIGGAWLVGRAMAAPIRMLSERADRLAAGRADLAFHAIPRPADEIGELVTRFSIMASGLERRQGQIPTGAGGVDDGSAKSGRRRGERPEPGGGAGD